MTITRLLRIACPSSAPRTSWSSTAHTIASAILEKKYPCLMVVLAGFLAACEQPGSKATSPPAVLRRFDSAGIARVDNPLVANDRDRLSLTLVKEVGVEEGDEHLMFSRIAGVGLNRSGDIVVGLRSTGTIRVFSPTGEFLREFGRPGNGPAELPALNRLWVRGDTIVAVHEFSGKTVGFFPDGKLVLSWAGPTDPRFPILVGVDSTGWLARVCDLPPTDGALGALRCFVLALGKTPGTEATTRYELLPRPSRRGEGMAEYPLFGPDPSLGLGFDQRGHSIQSHGYPYRIDVRDSFGKLVRVVTMGHEPIPVNAALVKRVKERIQARADSQTAGPGRQGGAAGPRGKPAEWQLSQFEKRADFPGYHAVAVPVTGRILVAPDGGFWLNRIDTDAVAFAAAWPYGNDLKFSRWDTFAADGEYQGYVEVPDHFSPHGIVGSRVIGVTVDSLDVERVAVFEVGNR